MSAIVVDLMNEDLGSDEEDVCPSIHGLFPARYTRLTHNTPGENSLS